MGFSIMHLIYLTFFGFLSSFFAAGSVYFTLLTLIVMTLVSIFLRIGVFQYVLILLVCFPEYVVGSELSITPFDIAKYFVLFALIFHTLLKPDSVKIRTFSLLGLLSLVMISLLGEQRLISFIQDTREVLFLAVFIVIMVMHNTVSNTNLSESIVQIGAGFLLAAVLLKIFGFGTERNGDFILFYGHPYGILMGLHIYFLLRRGQIFSFCLSTICLAYLIENFQSSHLLFVMGLLFLYSLKFNLKFFLPILFLTTAILIVVPFFLESGSWVALKVGQVASVTRLDFSTFNSVAIRALEASAVFYHATLPEVLFGSGVGSFYDTTSPLWSNRILHDGTFPLEQIANHKFSYLHEPILYLQKWFGIFGLIVIALLFRRSKFSSVEVLLILFFSIASIPASLTVFILMYFNVVGHDEKN